MFQIVQTRILSVLAWYYLAFFAISVAMLGMTVGAVWVHLRADRFQPERLAGTLANAASAAALSMPASLAIQFSLITTLTLSLTTIVAWSLLLGAMTVPYFFVGVAVSLALTRSPFPVSQVYAADLVGAALGCIAVVAVLNVLDAPSTVLLAGAIAAASAICFAATAEEHERARLRARGWLRRPEVLAATLSAFAVAHAFSPVRLQPILVKDRLESAQWTALERWNSYSRVVAMTPNQEMPFYWGASRFAPTDAVSEIALYIDGGAGTWIHYFDGSPRTIDFLRYDLTNLAYSLPGIEKAAVIGVGGGRDMLSAHLFGVRDVTGIELNPIFIDLLTRHPFYSSFNRLASLPGVRFVVDDARTWFASTSDRFDLIQMSMVDTWAATGAGAFSLSENGLYTLEGWRQFVSRLSDRGVLTVSRWYSPSNVNETGRMIALGVAAVLESGASDARPYLFVAGSPRLATLVLAKSPFTPAELQALRKRTEQLGFQVLLAPDQTPSSPLLSALAQSRSLDELDRAASSSAVLDVTVPTDDRPFFFNQLRFSSVPTLVWQMLHEPPPPGVISGNLLASGALVLILVLSFVAVVLTVLVPLGRVTRDQSSRFIALGSAYFALIGLGFMLAEIGLLQRFSVYLGHPIYSLGVCLSSLILASGLGSLASGFVPAGRRTVIAVGALAGCTLLALQQLLPALVQATSGSGIAGRVAVSLGALLPLGFLLGFAFPTGMRVVERIDPRPTPWFWGINGATGVLASVLAVMLGISFGIGATLLASAACYLALIPVGVALTASEEPALRKPSVSARSGQRLPSR